MSAIGEGEGFMRAEIGERFPRAKSRKWCGSPLRGPTRSQEGTQEGLGLLRSNDGFQEQSGLACGVARAACWFEAG